MDLQHRAHLRAPRVLWLLPWALTLVVSTSLAYAMNVAVGGGPPVQTAQVGVSPVPTPADTPAAGALFYDEEVDDACDIAPCRRGRRWLPAAAASCDTTANPRQYVGLNTWIPAEPKLALCPGDAS